MSCVLFVGAIALAVVAVTAEMWEQLFLAAFWALVSAYNLTVVRTRLRGLQEEKTHQLDGLVASRSVDFENEQRD